MHQITDSQMKSFIIKTCTNIYICAFERHFVKSSATCYVQSGSSAYMKGITQ